MWNARIKEQKHKMNKRERQLFPENTSQLHDGTKANRSVNLRNELGTFLRWAKEEREQ